MHKLFQPGEDVVDWLWMQNLEYVGDIRFHDLDDFIVLLFLLVDRSVIPIQLGTQGYVYPGDVFYIADVKFLRKENQFSSM